MKDEYCVLCESYLESPLSIAANVVGGWFGGKEKRKVNPIALSPRTVEKVVEGWSVQMEEAKKQKVHDAIVEGWKSQRERSESQKEQASTVTVGSQRSSSEIPEEKLVSVASADVEDEDSPSKTSEERLSYAESGGKTVSPGEEELALSFE